MLPATESATWPLVGFKVRAVERLQSRCAVSRIARRGAGARHCPAPWWEHALVGVRPDAAPRLRCAAERLGHTNSWNKAPNSEIS